MKYINGTTVLEYADLVKSTKSSIPQDGTETLEVNDTIWNLVHPSVDAVTFNPYIERLEEVYNFIDGKYIITHSVVPLFKKKADKDTALAKEQQDKLDALKSSITEAVQNRLDTFARTRNYDGILSACTYATSKIVKFAQEGQDAVDLRDKTWDKLYAIFAEVQAGTRLVPTSYADIEPELPVLAWTVV